MSITKKVARSIIFPSLMGLGFDKLIQASISNNCVNVMYHGVVEKDSTYFSPRHITAEQFEKHLKYFRRNFDVISLSEAFDTIRTKGSFKRKTITVSFDDGFQNNLTIALPLLEQYKIPTTFFVSSVCVAPNKQDYLWSELSAALNYFNPIEPVRIGEYTFINSYDSNRNMKLNDLIKTASYDDRDIILDRLKMEFDLDRKIRELPEEIWKLLTREEVIELSKSKLVEIGSHGHDHYNLGEINLEKAENELIESKRLLQEAIGKPVISIAYPDGSYTEQVKELAEKSGYQNQLAVTYRVSGDMNDNRIMNRHGIASTTTFESNMIFLNLAFHNKGVN